MSGQGRHELFPDAAVAGFGADVEVVEGEDVAAHPQAELVDGGHVAELACGVFGDQDDDPGVGEHLCPPLEVDLHLIAVALVGGELDQHHLKIGGVARGGTSHGDGAAFGAIRRSGDGWRGGGHEVSSVVSWSAGCGWTVKAVVMTLPSASRNCPHSR